MSISSTTSGHGTRAAFLLALGFAASGLGCEVYYTSNTCDGPGCEAPDTQRPAAPAGLDAYQIDRQSIAVEWIAPADSSGRATVRYELRIAGEPFFDEVFTLQGSPVATPVPGRPGTTEQVLINGLRLGQPYYVGIFAVDGDGQRSGIASMGPVVTDFDYSGPRLAPDLDDGDNALGLQIARGLLNGDEYYDLAVAAPFKQVGDAPGAGAVYVYFGSPDGIGSAPDMVIEGTASLAQLGNALAVIDWNGDGADDLAIGAPFTNAINGAVFIFHGGEAFTAGAALTDASADVTINAAPGSQWLASAGLGWSLAAGDFDGDDQADLAIGAAAADGGNGGLVVVYGGTATGAQISVSELDSQGMGGAVAHLISDPNSTGEIDLFGHVLANLGATEGVADTTDDLGIAYFQSDTVFVLRGRTDRPTAAGAYITAIDLARDAELRSDSADLDAYFGSALGSIADMDGDGAREIVVGGYLEGEDAGRVVIASGAAAGTYAITDLALATIQGEAGERFGSAVLNNAAAINAADIDGDGLEDLAIVGGHDAVALHVWFGDDLPAGEATAASAAHVVTAPEAFAASTPIMGGNPITATWVGDTNGDGLEDLAWADWSASAADGVFELLR